MDEAKEAATGGFGWDSEVDPTAEQKSRILLPEGAAKFVVTKLERKRMEYGKVGSQNVALITMSVASMVDTDLEPVEIQERLCLHADFQWKITQFFTAIGQRKHGDTGKFVPNWAKVDGADGICKIIQRQLTAKSGQKYSVNNINVYLSPDETIQSEPKF